MNFYIKIILKEKIIPQINHRTPKVVAANISALKEAIEYDF